MPSTNPENTVEGSRGYFFGHDGQPAFEVDAWPLQGKWAARITEIRVGPIATEPEGGVHLEPTEAEAKQWAEQYLKANRPSLVSSSYRPLWEPLRYNLSGTPALL